MGRRTRPRRRPARDRAPSRRWWGRTLRGRVTTALVLVLIAAFVATGFATALFLRGFLLDRLDAQLAAAGSRFAVSLEHGQVAPGGSDGDADNTVPGQSVGTLGVRIVNGNITNVAVVGSDGHNRTPDLSTHDVAALRSVRPGRGPVSLHLDALGDYRVESVDGRDSDVQVTGLPAQDLDDTVGRLIAIEVALFAFVVTLSGLAVALSVSRTLRPLRRVTDTALAVSELPLTEAATQLPDGIAPSDPTTEVDQVSVAFDHMLAHIRNALAERDHTEDGLRRFVADASHELRTPVATIKAYAEYALRSGDELPDTAATAFARIDVAATRMATLVEDLLLLARLDAGRPLARDAVDLSQLVLETVDDARTAAPGHHWHLDLPEDPLDVTGDSERLHQVLANLLGNARAHTPPGTTVTTTLRDQGGEVLLEIHDDGPGVPEELLAGLFDRFTHRHPTAPTEHGSAGLGLAIARGIVHAHNGRIDVVSRPGSTIFAVKLPGDSSTVIRSHVEGTVVRAKRP